MTEIYKILNYIATPIMTSPFQFHKNQYNLRNYQELSTEKRNTVNYSLESLTYWAPAIWAKLPPKYVHAPPLDEFKSRIKSWKCKICPCRLYKNYQSDLRCINYLTRHFILLLAI